MKDSDFHWLVGLLEGEGTFGIRKSTGRKVYKGKVYPPYRTPNVALKMTDRDVVDRAAKLLGSSTHPCAPAKGKRKASWMTRVEGAKAVQWMRVLEPYLAVRRQAQIAAVMQAMGSQYLAKVERKLAA